MRQLLTGATGLDRNRVRSEVRQRLTALFFLLAFVAGMLASTASVYAAEKAPKQKSTGSIATQKATYDTVPLVEELALASKMVDDQGTRERKKEKSDLRKIKREREKASERTLQSRTYELEDGSELIEATPVPQNYTDDDGTIKPIDFEPIRDEAYEQKNKVPESFWERILPGSPQPVGYKATEGDLEVYFETIGKGGIRIVSDDKELQFAPKTNKTIKPQLKEADNGAPYILYEDVWPDVDVYYAYHGTAVKEHIRLKKNTGQTSFQFGLKGAKVTQGDDGAIRFDGPFADVLALGELSINVNLRGPVEEGRPTYAVRDGGRTLTVELKREWLKQQDKKAFPMVIDPAIFDQSTIPGGDYGWYEPYKSDGYKCPNTSCNVNIGALNDNGLKSWRTLTWLPYEQIMGRQLLEAWVYLEMTNMAGWPGYYDNRTVWVTWANCGGFGCNTGGAPHVSGTVGSSGWINVTAVLEWLKNNNITGGWLIFWGEEWHTTSYKQIRPAYMKLDMHTNRYPAMPSPQVPSSNPNTEVVLTTTQPMLGVSSVSDPDGALVKYRYQVRSSNGVVLYQTDQLAANRLTIPEGLLQDGGSYAWSYTVADDYWESGWQNGGKFKVDLRTGKDKTSTYEQVGPVSVSLNNGNVYTSVDSHGIQALDGTIGVSLEYNSPYASRTGLRASYYNNTSLSGSPVLTRTEATVDANWSTGSPSTGVVNADGFGVRWEGWFVAPQTGSYYFGGIHDDTFKIYINDQLVYNNSTWTSTRLYGSAVSLQAGQVAKIKIELAETGGPGGVRLYVKGAVNEQVVPSEWLRTSPMLTEQNTGLMGHYYADNGSHDFANSPKLMTRKDPAINFQWGSTPPIPGMQADGLLVRWEGYFTPPVTGTYTFGAKADDGVRIKINNNTVMQNWAAGAFPLIYGSGVFLTANNPVPITVEYFEVNHGAYVQLYAKTPNDSYGSIVESRYLSPGGRILPAGWNISADADGNLAYERLEVRQNGDVIMYDADGTTRLFTNTGNGFKPPVDVDATLVRNLDGTYSLTDTDGRAYVFNMDGTLRETQAPLDDLKPAAIKYNYTTQNGIPKLTEIIDGVDSSRKGYLYYQGDSQCASPPNGYVAPPTSNLCAFVTSDGQRTDFFYSQDPTTGNKYLARVALPGGAKYEMGYDSNGMLLSVRDVLANDVIGAGLRDDDVTTKTELAYDQLARLTKIKQPAATAGAMRIEHQIEYKSGDTLPVTRYYQPSGPETHVTSTVASWPGSPEAWVMLYALKTERPGTRAFYSCQRPGGQYFASADSNCYGNTQRGKLGYLYTQPTGDATVALSRMREPGGYVLEYPATSLSGWTTEEVIGYGFPNHKSAGLTLLHTSPGNEPNGYTQYIEYDNLLRTTKACNKAGLCTTSEWHAQKDLELSRTDATGLKSTTIYDADDRPIDSYGPAPAAWFGADRKPLAQYASQVPRTQTNYDEGLIGPAVAWYNFKGNSLVGAPRLHATGFNPADPSRFWTNTTVAGSPAPPIQPTDGATGVGFRATAKIYAPTTGAYNLYLIHANAARVWVDDKLVIDNWSYRNNTTYAEKNASISLTAGKPARLLMEYSNAGGSNTVFRLELSGNGVTTPNGTWGNLMRPGYNLTTSTKVFDAQVGDVTSVINYGSKPELGQAQSTTVDPTGLNLATSATYEPYQTGSFMRQTSKTLPGGTITNYAYYNATETRDNPCTPETEAHKQAGLLKQKTEADPDGTGSQTPRTSEVVYDDAGRTVASRFNNDPWTCTTYDDRGRVVKTVVPTINGRPGRTVTTNYNYQGNPLKTQVVDSVAGSTVSEIDLLGRTVSATDQFGNVSAATYDTQGRLASKTTPAGTESYTYDEYDRVTEYKHNDAKYATITYDQYSRVQDITYNQAKDANDNKLKLEQIKRDALQRTNGAIFRFSDGTAFDETVNRSQSGMVTGYSDTFGGNTAGGAYTYDKAGRLTGATIDGNTYSYGYGVPTGCSGNYNPNAHKNSNRTSFTANGQTTTYCYDQADRLISSTDAQLGTPTYDDHGNTISLAGDGEPIIFTYDAADSNTAIQQGDYKVEYVKTASGNILRKKEYEDNQLTKSYRYLAGGSVLQTCNLTNDNDCTTTDTYLGLPGGTTLTLSPANPDETKRTIYSIKNFHGDTAIIAGADGTPTSSVYLYEPFGQPSTSATFGTNSNPTNATDQPMGWAANPTRKVAGSFSLPIIQMGARVYLPTAGRFLQVDPVEGGTLNSYVYAHDPINLEDYSGLFFVVKALEVIRQAVTRAVPYVQKAVNAMKSTPKVTPNVPKAAEIAKRAEQARKLASQNKLTYTESAAKHLPERSYMNSNLLIREMMKTQPMADPRGAPGTVMWRTLGTNWNAQWGASREVQLGFYELVVHPESGKIYHFLFKPLK